MGELNRGPRLAQLQGQAVKFQPGDRLIVRLHHRLDRDDQAKLMRMVRRWAGPDVEVLLVDLNVWDVSLDRPHLPTDGAK